MSSTTARLSALESQVSSLDSKIDRLFALLEPEAPAKTKRVTRKAPARKAQPKAVRHLTRKNRQDFVKAHAWAKGLSTQVIASMCVEDPRLLTAGWGIGERYTEMFSA